LKTEVACLRSVSKHTLHSYSLINISFRIYSGEILNIATLNDLGKFALVSILSGLDSNYSGEYLINNVKVDFGNLQKASKHGIFCISTVDTLIPNMSVAENMCLTQRSIGSAIMANKKVNDTLACVYLKKYNIHIQAKNKASSLSKFERKIIEIMRAVILKAQIIILDDIASSFNESENKTLHQLLKQLKNDGVAIVLIGCEIKRVYNIVDRILVLNSGKMGGMFYAGEYDPDVIHRSLIYRKMLQVKIVEREKKNTLIEFCDVTAGKLFKEFNGSISTGEVVTFVDTAGKAIPDILKLMNGEMKYSGKIKIDGKIVTLKGRKSSIESGIGCISKCDSHDIFFKNLTIGENLLLMKYAQFSNKAQIIKKELCAFALREYQQMYGLPDDFFDKYPNDLNLHDIAYIQLLKWSILQPKVLLMNQPFVGADSVIEKNINQFLVSSKASGISVIYYSLLSAEIEKVCDRVLVLDEGKLIAIR